VSEAAPALNNPDEPVPVVLLPEPQDPVIHAVSQNYTDEQLGVTTRYEEMSLEQAAQELKAGRADIVLAGIAHDTPSVLDVILKHFRKPDTLVSSYFAMEKDGDEPMFYADCAVVPNPSPHDLVRIAEHTSESARHLGYEPVVAFLSLETFEAEHASSEKIPGVVQVREAALRFKKNTLKLYLTGQCSMTPLPTEEYSRKRLKLKVSN
jgi:phosphotransacetylase